ncbi:MAG: VCBS domain-containing protein [Methylococcales bacterium]|nr:VCBS domain-containing protein [Methylococcales bacterium]
MNVLITFVALLFFAVSSQAQTISQPRPSNDFVQMGASQPTVTGNALSNDRNSVNATLVSNPNGRFGFLQMDNSGTFTYTLFQNLAEIENLSQGQFFDESFRYAASNEQGWSNNATITVRIIGDASPPRPENDLFSIRNTDTGVIGDALLNDRDGDTALLVSSPVGRFGDLILDASGSFTYTLLQTLPEVANLDQGQVLEDRFTYALRSAQGITREAQIIIRIAGDRKPTPRNDLVALFADDDSVSGNVLDNDDDGTGATLISSPAGQFGLLTFSFNGSFTYTLQNRDAIVNLTPGQVLEETFTYQLVNEQGAGQNANLIIRIVGGLGPQPRNDAIALFSTETTAAGNVLDNDLNGDNANLVSSPAGRFGILQLSPNGGFVYTLSQNLPEILNLEQGQIVTDSFTYQLSNAQGATSSATLTVQIIGGSVDATPQARNDFFTVVANRLDTVSGNVIDNDINVENVRLTSPAATTHGFLVFNQDGSFTYTLQNNAPDILNLPFGQTLRDQFVYTQDITAGTTTTAVLTIEIIGNPVDENGNTVFEEDANDFTNVDIEFNNRSQDAVPLNSGRAIRGQLSAPNDKDWFTLFSSGNEEITMELCPQGTSCFGKKNWAVYIIDPDLLTDAIELNEVVFRRWLDETGSAIDPAGNQIISGLNGQSNHLYLNYRQGIFESALLGIIDPCFDTSNTVGLGVREPKTYLIAVSSVLTGDADSGDSCGQGRVVLQEPGLPVVGTNADGDTESFSTTQEVIRVPFSDDQYAIRITATGRDPLLSEVAVQRSALFRADNGIAQVPEIRIGDHVFSAQLQLQIEQAVSAVNFDIGNIEAVENPELNPFRATYNPANNQVMIPRVTDQSSGKAYSIILRYHPPADGQDEWLELIAAQAIL